MKKEQNHVARSLPKKPSEPKHIVCHHCGAFRNLRSHSSKFHALKRIKRKEKLEFLRSCAKKSKLDLSENSMSLKKVVNALNSLSMCISSSHSSNSCLSSHETFISNNFFVWMRKGSYGWVFTLFSPWSNSFNLCRVLYALDAIYSCICASCIYLYALFLFFILVLCK